MERRFLSIATCPVKLEDRAEGQQPKIIGYGAVFYDGSAGSEYNLWEGMVERIMPTAFDRAVKEDDVRGLFNHNPDHLLGRTASKTMVLAVDAKGLRYEIDPADTAMAIDVVKSIRRGDLTGSSFAFIPVKTVWIEEETRWIREIHEVRLFDCGPVTYPAYEATTTGLRAMGDPADARKELDAFKAGRRSAEAAKSQVNVRADMVRMGLE